MNFQQLTCIQSIINKTYTKISLIPCNIINIIFYNIFIFKLILNFKFYIKNTVNISEVKIKISNDKNLCK